MYNSKWILDTNVPFLLKEFLSSKGIDCSTAQEHGWGELKNGELVKASFDNGFRVILTRDKLFIESASRTLKFLPDVSIVLLALPQLKESELKQLLIASWNHNNIYPVAGQLVLWPENQP
jgi:predicted nuclease of predicted toxin-antitoxin system